MNINSIKEWIKLIVLGALISIILIALAYILLMNMIAVVMEFIN